MAITNHIKGAVEKFKAKTGTELKDHVLNATYLNGLEGTSYVDLTSAQTITGTKNFDVAYANVFATGTGAGNYFQCQKFRGEGNASTYYHALDFGYAGHNRWDFFEYGGIYNFYQNTSADGSGKVNLFRISPDGVTSHKSLIAESTLTAKGAFTSSTSTILSSVKSAGILGTDSAGKVYDNSSAYQKAGNYATKSDLTKYQPAGNYQPKGDYVPFDNASKDVYLGSHGIYSGVRPSSGSATLTGNGYWIQESSVGVSSAVSGGVAVSSKMTPDYISVHNGKIKINSSGIVSDSGTFTFDGNPGSVATNADLKNYVTINTAQTISSVKTFSDSIILPPKNAIMLGTGADGKIYNNTDFYNKKLDGIVLKDMTKANTNGYYCFGYDYNSKLTQHKTLSGFFGHATAHTKGGMVPDNNTTFVGFGKASGYPWFGLTEYNRDYSDGVNAQLVKSYGIMVRKGDVAGHSSAYILDGDPSTDTETRLVTEDELADKQAKLVSGTNIKTINGNSILGSGNLSISADLSLGYDYDGFNTGFYNTQYDHKNLLNLSSATIQGDNVYKWGTVINVTPNDSSSMVQFYVPDGVGRDGYNHRFLIRSGWGLNSSTMANWQKTTAWEQILTRNTCPNSFADIINSTTTKSAYCQIGDLLIQWGIFTGANGDTTNWTVTYPKSFWWYPAVILQTKDTTTNSGISYSNGAVITSYSGGSSFTFQLRRSETCSVYWIAIGGLK